ncbi:MAG: NAD(P)-dependent oxidoreductase [Bacteroidales bacterium]
MKKVLIIDDAHTVMIEKFNRAGFEVVCNEEMTRDDILRDLHMYTAIVIRSKIIADTEFIDAGTNLKCIGRIGAGMETVDTEYAESKNIRCLNSPEGNKDAVGEHALGMLLSLANNLNKADREVRNSVWDREGNRGFEIMGKTIGIIGYGNMGRAFAQKISGFGAHVIAYDKYKQNFSDAFVQECTLDELQLQSDIISLHVPQTDETIGMVNTLFIEKCAKPFVLINTARGKVVDTAALVYGMKNGSIRAAALDVLEYESFNFQDFLTDSMPDPFEYLRTSSRVLFSPHIAGWTVESKEKLSSVLADKIIECLGTD